MSKTNCINCGAQKEINDTKCPFCGTKYLDMTAYNLFSGDPLYLQMYNQRGEIVTAKAYVTSTNLNMEPEVLSVRTMDGQVRRHISAVNVTGSIGFALFESLKGD